MVKELYDVRAIPQHPGYETQIRNVPSPALKYLNNKMLIPVGYASSLVSGDEIKKIHLTAFPPRDKWVTQQPIANVAGQPYNQISREIMEGLGKYFASCEKRDDCIQVGECCKMPSLTKRADGVVTYREHDLPAATGNAVQHSPFEVPLVIMELVGSKAVWGDTELHKALEEALYGLSFMPVMYIVQLFVWDVKILKIERDPFQGKLTMEEQKISLLAYDDLEDGLKELFDVSKVCVCHVSPCRR